VGHDRRKYNDALAKAAVRGSCIHVGLFDSIPFDMGVYFSATEAQKRFGAAPLSGMSRSLRRHEGDLSLGGNQPLRAKKPWSSHMGQPEGHETFGIVRYCADTGFEGPKQPYGNKPP